MTYNSRTSQTPTIWKTVIASGITMMLFATSPGASIRSVESYLRNDSNLSLFTKAMDIANFWERLTQEESLILLVPTDKAMSVEGSDFLLQSVLMTKDNRQRLEALVAAHIIVGVDKLDLDSGPALLPTLSGDCLIVNQHKELRSVGPGARVLSDVVVGGTRIITVDKLLIPDYQPSNECMAQIMSTRNK